MTVIMVLMVFLPREDGLAIKWGNGWYDTIEGVTEIYGSTLVIQVMLALVHYMEAIKVHITLQWTKELASNSNADFNEAKIWKFDNQ